MPLFSDVKNSLQLCKSCRNLFILHGKFGAEPATFSAKSKDRRQLTAKLYSREANNSDDPSVSKDGKVLPIAVVNTSESGYNDPSKLLLVVPFHIVPDCKSGLHNLMTVLTMLKKYVHTSQGPNALNQHEKSNKDELTKVNDRTLTPNPAKDLDSLEAFDFQTVLPKCLEKDFKDVSISSLEINYDVDMEPIKKAFLSAAARKSGIDLSDININDIFEQIKPQISFQSRFLTADPGTKQNSVPLNFSATIHGKVLLDPQNFASGNITDLLNMGGKTASGKYPALGSIPLPQTKPMDQSVRHYSGSSKNLPSQLEYIAQLSEKVNELRFEIKQILETHDIAINTNQIVASSDKDKKDEPRRASTDVCKKKDGDKGKDGGKKDDPCKKSGDKGKDGGKKDDPCKKSGDKGKDGGKKDDPCKKGGDKDKKKDDPCKKDSDKKKDPCEQKIENRKPKKTEDPCKQKQDPCKKDKGDPCKKKNDKGGNDPCKKNEKKEEKKEKKDTEKKKEDPCKKNEKKASDKCLGDSFSRNSLTPYRSVFLSSTPARLPLMRRFGICAPKINFMEKHFAAKQSVLSNSSVCDKDD